MTAGGGDGNTVGGINAEGMARNYLRSRNTLKRIFYRGPCAYHVIILHHEMTNFLVDHVVATQVHDRCHHRCAGNNLPKIFLRGFERAAVEPHQVWHCG